MMHRFIAMLAIFMLILTACGGAADTDDGEGDDTSAVIEGVDKGTITYGQAVEDTLATDPAHRYQFTGAAGDVLQIRLNATGSTFYAPYAFVYGADEALVVSSDTTRRARSENLSVTLAADGTYILVIEPLADTVPGGYSVTINKTE